MVEVFVQLQEVLLVAFTLLVQVIQDVNFHQALVQKVLVILNSLQADYAVDFPVARLVSSL